MGRRIITLGLAFILFSFFCTNAICAEYEEANQMEITQISDDLPKMYIFVKGLDNTNVEDLEIYLDEQELVIDSSDDAMGIDSEEVDYILLDVSASITKKDFEKIKNYVAKLVNLKKGNIVVLMTFGNDVLVKYSGIADEDKISQLLNNISNSDVKTALYAALKRVTELGETFHGNVRKKIYIFTDGDEDFVSGITTINEISDKLLISEMTPYFYMVNSNKEQIDTLGELARNSGGNVFLIEDFISSVEKNEEENAIICLLPNKAKLNKKSTIVLNNKKTNQKVVRECFVDNWEKDFESPYVKNVEILTEKSLKVMFSEAVCNVNDVDSYLLFRNDKQLEIESVAYNADNLCVQINTRETLISGSYSLFSNTITDMSYEQNELLPLEKEYLSGFDDCSETQREELINTDDKSNIFLILLISLFFLILCCFLVWTIIIRKRKGVLLVNNRVMLADSVTEHERIEIANEEKTHVLMVVLKNGIQIYKKDISFQRSIIVGRADICDYAFSEDTLSKQHFSIEYENECMYVTDLESSNGTLVNGYNVRNKQQIKSGDVVTAGNLSFMFRW